MDVVDLTFFLIIFSLFLVVNIKHSNRQSEHKQGSYKT